MNLFLLCQAACSWFQHGLEGSTGGGWSWVGSFEYLLSSTPSLCSHRAVSIGKSVQKARYHLGLGRLPLILVHLREKHRGLFLLFDLDSYQVREIERRLYNRQAQKKTA